MSEGQPAILFPFSFFLFPFSFLIRQMRFHIFLAYISLSFVLFLAGPLYAQVKVLRIEPGQTDPAIATVHGPNVALYDPKVASNHRLFFFIGGTGSKACRSKGHARLMPIRLSAVA